MPPGQWERIERSQKALPFLLYSAQLDSRTRPAHRAWNGIVRPVGDPFWNTHAPLNGWRCRCFIIQLSQRGLKRRGLAVSPPPTVKTKPWHNARTGQTIDVPEGIDPGWGYNVGQARMRALTPPPLDRPLSFPYMGDPAKVPPPPARPTPLDLLPEGQPAEWYVRQFLDAFSVTDLNGGVLLKDVLGEPIVISAELFRTSQAGHWKIKFGRGKDVLLLADALKDPDEIWWVWQKHPGEDRYILRRRYLKRVQINGQDKPLLVAFEVGKDGWTGITAFGPEKTAYLDRQRIGTLAWRRPG